MTAPACFERRQRFATAYWFVTVTPRPSFTIRTADAGTGLMLTAFDTGWMDRAVDTGVVLIAVDVGVMLRAVIGTGTTVVPSRVTDAVPNVVERGALLVTLPDAMLTESFMSAKDGLTGPSTRTVGRWSTMINAASSAVNFLIDRGIAWGDSGLEYEDVIGGGTGAVCEPVVVPEVGALRTPG